MKITEAFSRYGASLRNVNWSVSSENAAGELVVSLWQHHFEANENRSIKYVDRVSRWSGHGNTEFRKRIDKAYSTQQIVRVIIARTDDEKAVDNGKDASKLKNTFSGRLGEPVSGRGQGTQRASKPLLIFDIPHHMTKRQ